jgi:integrase
MKAYIYKMVESQEPMAARSVFYHLKDSIHRIEGLYSIIDLTYPKILKALDALRPAKQDWQFGHVRRWYNWCLDNEIPNFDPEIAEKFNQLTISANASGVRVMSRDPKDGPFSDSEFWQIRQAVKRTDVPLIEQVCVMVLLELGVRPGQAVQLDEDDFRVTQIGDSKKMSS